MGGTKSNCGRCCSHHLGRGSSVVKGSKCEAAQVRGAQFDSTHAVAIRN